MPVASWVFDPASLKGAAGIAGVEYPRILDKKVPVEFADLTEIKVGQTTVTTTVKMGKMRWVDADEVEETELCTF